MLRDPDDGFEGLKYRVKHAFVLPVEACNQKVSRQKTIIPGQELVREQLSSAPTMKRPNGLKIQEQQTSLITYQTVGHTRE